MKSRILRHENQLDTNYKEYNPTRKDQRSKKIETNMYYTLYVTISFDPSNGFVITIETRSPLYTTLDIVNPNYL